MTIRRDAQLDPGQVRDRRGKGAGIAIGGGLGGIIALVLFLVAGGDPSQLAGLDGQTVGSDHDTELTEECRTGADAATRDDCRMVGYVNSVQAYWSGAVDGYQLATTTFFD
ncbi:MAG TPA: hypothetical protein VMM81_08250, partial [Acidimicrobiia bacterium]|nr:hypothetical protein [Acidimicrobiia bacterium]